MKIIKNIFIKFVVVLLGALVATVPVEAQTSARQNNKPPANVNGSWQCMSRLQSAGELMFTFTLKSGGAWDDITFRPHKIMTARYSYNPRVGKLQLDSAAGNQLKVFNWKAATKDSKERLVEDVPENELYRATVCYRYKSDDSQAAKTEEPEKIESANCIINPHSDPHNFFAYPAFVEIIQSLDYAVPNDAVIDFEFKSAADGSVLGFKRKHVALNTSQTVQYKLPFEESSILIFCTPGTYTASAIITMPDGTVKKLPLTGSGEMTKSIEIKQGQNFLSIYQPE